MSSPTSNRYGSFKDSPFAIKITSIGELGKFNFLLNEKNLLNIEIVSIANKMKGCYDHFVENGKEAYLLFGYFNGTEYLSVEWDTHHFHPETFKTVYTVENIFEIKELFFKKGIEEVISKIEKELGL